MIRTTAAIMLSTVTLGILGAGAARAESYRVVVTIENLAPRSGTSQTPHWVGFHDGTFDIYDGNTPADNDPVPADPRRSVERLAEDGNTAPITETFGEIQPEGVDGTIAGPNGALGPGEITSQSFLLDSHNAYHRYFSYASMVLPSNDFWYANGNPLQHAVFDDSGKFIAEDFFVTNDNLLDAGTEKNDEVPENTAFFGQSTPNTGVDEDGVILDFRDDDGNPQFAFLPEGSGGILDDPRFAMADFSKTGYPVVKISFEAFPAISEEMTFFTALNGDAQVPPVHTEAAGLARYNLFDAGTSLNFIHLFTLKTREITAAHLHLGAIGENGPVIATLVDDTSRELRLVSRAPRFRTGGSHGKPEYVSSLQGNLSNAELEGPLQGQPLDALVQAIQEGNVYINVHTDAFPDGEIRGQLYIASQGS